MEFMRIWAIIVRRKWLILVLFFAFFLAAVAGTKLMTPFYKARVKLLVDDMSDTSSALLSGLGITGLPKQSNAQSTADKPYDTDVAITTLRPNLDRLIATLHLKKRNGEPTQYDRLTENFVTRLILPEPYIEVAQYEEASILKIDAYSPNPEEAANMANKLGEYTIADRIERRRQNYKAARMFIDGNIGKAREEYAGALEAIKNYKIRNQTVNLDVETQNLLNKIVSLNSTYEDNEKSIVDAEKRIETAKSKIRESPMYRKEYEDTTLNDQLKQLRTKLSELLTSRAEKSVDYTGEHPEYQKLLKEMDEVRDQMKAEAQMTLSSSHSAIDPVYDQLYQGITSISIDKEAAVAKRNVIRSTIDRYEKDLLKLPPMLMDDAKLSLKLSEAKNVYTRLLDYQKQVGVAEAMTMSSAVIVERAAPPPKDNPYVPKKTLNYILGLFLAGFWSLFIAFSVDYADPSIKTAEEVKQLGSPRLLGALPRPLPWRPRPLVAALNPRDPMVEAFRALRLNLRQAAGDRPLKSLLVTSSVERERTAFVGANYAAAGAMDGVRTILVDLDLRTPAVHRFFGLQNGSGIAQVLAGTARLEDVIASTPHRGLDVLVGGPPPADPYLEVRSPRLPEILRTLADGYDQVVITSAPLARVGDPATLAPLVDGVLLVAQTGRSTTAMIVQAGERAASPGFPLLGVAVIET